MVLMSVTWSPEGRENPQLTFFMPCFFFLRSHLFGAHINLCEPVLLPHYERASIMTATCFNDSQDSSIFSSVVNLHNLSLQECHPHPHTATCQFQSTCARLILKGKFLPKGGLPCLHPIPLLEEWHKSCSFGRYGFLNQSSREGEKKEDRNILFENPH